MGYKANYQPYDLTHSNYRGYFYKNSAIDAINLRGTFTAQDTTEANYLLAVIHFFRSVTKMFYGQDAERVIEAMKRRILPTTLGSDDIGPFRQITLPVDKVAGAINAVNQLGWSVAIVDRHGARLVCVAIVPAVVKTVEKEEAFV
jgi:hypothetical protein